MISFLNFLHFILLEQTLEQLTELDNGLAAIWFNQQIVNINIKE
ncbi:hypothetical protein PLAN_70211 [Planktothrix rubescens CCAP 1459/22]|uniref:Uncharacterized protein n=1 Tax=Planktothrix rubescens CCAP 1459/22 TaxID=329571 RepID=A0A6J7ZT31_PLARU|nr:hypothetical protein PLAN_70211 [Planktothrix rubescens NIVA-CYA 18]